jgi:hypothetical protein
MNPKSRHPWSSEMINTMFGGFASAAAEDLAATTTNATIVIHNESRALMATDPPSPSPARQFTTGRDD